MPVTVTLRCGLFTTEPWIRCQTMWHWGSFNDFSDIRHPIIIPPLFGAHISPHDRPSKQYIITSWVCKLGGGRGVNFWMALCQFLFQKVNWIMTVSGMIVCSHLQNLLFSRIYISSSFLVLKLIRKSPQTHDSAVICSSLIFCWNEIHAPYKIVATM
jgi:hypothetical protein